MPTMRRLLLGALAICWPLANQPAAADTTERVSVSSTAVEGNDDVGSSAVSADGRFVAFDSSASNLVDGDTNAATDVFVHDRRTGVTERVSVDSLGNEATGGSTNPAISADGRFVAFASNAPNLVADDTNSTIDIFVHDRMTGTTERVNVDSIGGEAVGGGSNVPSVSADGRFVAFASSASNLVASDGNSAIDVFVHDRQTGVTQRVSVDSAGNEGNASSEEPAISTDGRFVAFSSSAENLVASDINLSEDVFVHDRQTGVTERVSVDSAETEANSHSFAPSISSDGRFVAFASFATNLIASDTNNRSDVFLRDRLTGTTERLSVNSTGNEVIGHSDKPVISADGRLVAFHSDATTLVADDTNAASDVFVRDRLTGATQRASVASAGAQATGGSYDPRVSADGRFIAFRSDAADLVPGDSNGGDDIFVRDLGLLPDGNNDFLADFGGAGLWQRLNDAAWQKIHTASPMMVTAGDLDGSLKDEAIVSFGGAGLWARYDNMTWVKLHNSAPIRFVVGDFDGNGTDDLVADLGAAGLWVRKNDSSWAKLHNGTSQDLAVGDLDGNGKDELIVDFGAAGLWVRTNDATWAKRHNASPVHIATGDLDGNGQDELIADFGAAGIWTRYNDTTWAKRHNGTSQDLAVGDLDGNDQEDLVVDFGAAGLWVRYNDATWLKRHNASPLRMLATDLDGNGKSELVVDFGAAGLWVKRNNGAWTKLHNSTTQGLAAGGFD